MDPYSLVGRHDPRDLRPYPALKFVQAYIFDDNLVIRYYTIFDLTLAVFINLLMVCVRDLELVYQSSVVVHLVAPCHA